MIQVVSDSILILVLNLLSLGSAELHTGHTHPIRGTPVLVPDPRMVIRNKVVGLKFMLQTMQCASLPHIIFENHASIYQSRLLVGESIQVRY